MNRIRWFFGLFVAVLIASTALAVDLNEGFVDTAFPPVAWQNLNTGDGANMWYRSTSNPHDTPGTARVSYEDLTSGLTAERWLISPKLHVNAASDTFGFWVRTLYSSTSDNDSLYVRLSTTDSLPASFTTDLGSYKCGSGGDFINVYVMYSYLLTAYVGQDIFVAFVHRDEGNGGNDIFIDDVAGPELLAPPNLPTTPDPANNAIAIPASTNLSWVNGIGTTTIDLYLAQSFDSVNNSDPDARKITNTLAESYDPPTDLAAEVQYFWKVVTRNVYGETHGPVWNFTVIGEPLSGSYDIGGGNNDYPNFSSAATALNANGISGPVVFNVYGTDYDDSLKLGTIAGTSETNTILFQDVSGTARIKPSATYVAAVYLDGCDFVTLDGIDVSVDSVDANSTKTRKCVRFGGSATTNTQNCTVKNATLTANGYTSSISNCVYMLGRDNHDNKLQNLTMTNARTAVTVSSYSTAGQQSQRLLVENCTISDVWAGFDVGYMDGMVIRDCDIQLNAGGSGAWGLDVGSMVAGDTIFFYNNKVHNFVCSGECGMVITSMGGLDRVAYIYNNFCYDFQPTGLVSVRPLKLGSGTHHAYFNSTHINDIAGMTSNGYSVANLYTTSGSTGSYDVRNNIFASLVQDTCFGYYQLLSGPTLTLDNNAYYGASETAHWVAFIGHRIAELEHLQDSTGYEPHGVAGDPGFTSATDLHLLNTNGLCHLNGTPIEGITEDIDGDVRFSTPDIGADEYDYLAPSDDYAVKELYGLTWLNGEFAPITTDAWVQNRGSSNQSNVKVTLFYDDIPQDSVYVSLNVGESDTVTFNWTTPAAPDTIEVKVQSFLAGDAIPENDYTTQSIRIVSPPMSGTYTIGGETPNYANFTAAVGALTVRGIDGPVVFDVRAETFSESIVIPAITGVSETNTITFQEADVLLTPPEIVGAATTVQLNGASYVTFDGIDITANSNGRTVLVSGGSTNNTFKNLSITGNDVTNTGTYAVDVSGGNYTVFDNVAVSGANYGVRFYGSSSVPGVGNELKNSSVAGGKYATYLYYQDGSSIHHCDIQPGWLGANTEIYGVYASTHAAAMSSRVHANQIHNIQSQSTCNGIYSSTGSGSLVAYNNFVYDWQGPTGSSVMYGLRAAGGTSEWYFNSVHIGDIATTGNIYGFYITGTSTAATVQNNIFQVDEPVEECWAIYRSGGTLTSDYNCFYSSGPGALYNLGYSGGNFANLAAWQGAGYDASSVEGNPGYLSATDLHIIPTFELLNGAGLAIDGIATDIDGEDRGTPPDIGADEYVFESLPHDYGVNGFVGLQPTYLSNTPVVIQVTVQNYGTQNETDVPIRLYYNDVEQDMALLSLTAGQTDVVDLDWTPPITGFEIGELKAKAFCPSDGFAPNDSATASVTTIGGPMSGVYDLGGGAMDFATFNEAVTALLLRGIDGEVVIDCYEGTYEETITLTPITGANFTDRVIFQAHEGALDDIVTLTGSAGAVVVFSDADYITFDGINLTSIGSSDTAAVIRNDADYITLKNLTVTGRSTTSTSVKGISIRFDGNDNCTIDNVAIGGATNGIRCEGGSGIIDNLEVMNCTIVDAAYGVYLDECSNSRVHDNDIQPQSYSTTSSAYGVYLGSTTAADVVYKVYNNRVHNLRSTGTSISATIAGIWAGANRTHYVYNNFIWDWQVNGSDCYGIYVSSGTTYAYNNSIRMNDVNTDAYAGIYISTGTAYAKNNVIQSDEDANTCYGIWRSGGTLSESDYNCFYGTGTGFNVGRDGTTSYPTLIDWQMTGRDMNAVVGDPGFISASDLHIDPLFTLLNAAGTDLSGIVDDDIDGDPRGTPPDIGADEYAALVAPDPVTELTVIRDELTDSVILRWVASPNANSYKIYCGDAPGFTPAVENQVGHTGSVEFTHEDILLTGEIKFYVVLGSTDAPPAR